MGDLTLADPHTLVPKGRKKERKKNKQNPKEIE
jgi:hypothetical protein